MKNTDTIRRHLNLTLTVQEELLRRSLYNNLVKAVLCEVLTTEAPLRVLDIGAGRGELMRILSQHGCDVSGIDVDNECVQLGRKIGRCLHGGVEDICELFNPEEFDVIVCSHVLEHLCNPFAALELMVKIKAKSYVLAVPNPLRSIRILRALIGSHRPDHQEHVYAWGFAEFEALLLRAGLKSESWYADRVTINPFRGAIGASLSRILSPVETVLLPKLFPMFSSSLIVRCRRINSDSVS